MTEAPLLASCKKEKLVDVAPKSSSEILSELFGVFNAKPPTLTDEVISDDGTKKRKKSKKKHKHKKKKKKKASKRGRSSSDASNSDSESEPAKKKSKKSKHKKHKHKKDGGESDSGSSTPIVTVPNWDANNGVKSENSPDEQTVDLDKIKIEDDLKNGIDKQPSELDKMNEIPIPKMPDISQIKLPEEKKVTNKTGTDTMDKSKSGTNKIQIKNLKFSSVFEANVKQAEEEARKKAEKYEDGELSDTSSTTNSAKVAISEESNSEVEPNKSSDSRDKTSKTSSESKPEKSSSKSSTNDKSDKHASERSSEKSSRRSRSKSKTKSHKSSRKRSRSKSGSKTRDRSRSKSRHKSKSGRSGSYSRSKSRHYYDRHDDRSRSHRHERRKSKEKDSRIDIDKKRLLEIARKNAITMLQTGTLPVTANLGSQAQQNAIAAIKCGGKSVDELTDFCKNLSRQEAIGELSSVTSGSDGENGDPDATKPFNNPFQIKDRAPIVLNIKGGTPLPTQSFQEKTLEQTKVLRQQFPVSSGSQHRGAENEWRPVSPPNTINLNSTSKTSHENNIGTLAKISDDKINSTANLLLGSTKPKNVPTPSIPAILPGPQVFPVEVVPNIDIGSIVSQRLTAIRKLQQNPNDTVAIDQMYQANQEMSKWAQSKQEPGQFTGSTGAQILTPKELASGYQAWARKDQLQTAAPVSSGMGMHLLQKMGWKPGEGLGKQKNGALTPLLLEVKLDTRGLVAKEETRQRPNMKKPYVPTVKTLSGKHPVSLLGEYCSKRKLGVPSYTLCFECGPDHKKNFLFKVTVNGIEYQPSVASANKKQAKADAATVCLQKLGIMP